MSDRNRRVVFATDEPFFVQSQVDALQESGYEVTVVQDTGKYLELLRTNKVDATVIFGGRLSNWAVLPKAQHELSRDGRLAAVAAVVAAALETDHFVPTVFIKTVWKIDPKSPKWVNLDMPSNNELLQAVQSLL